MIELIAALGLGVASSAHCVAMCGPLVLALHGPAHAGSVGRLVAHHAGRLATYAMLGLVAGGLGHLAATVGLGRILAVTAGLTLLASLVRQGRILASWRAMTGVGALIQRGLAFARARVDRHPVLGGFALGGFNGLLPCTPIYAAVTAAAALADPARAVAFMLLFGLGTIPSLALVSALAAGMPPSVRRRARVATPVAIALVALLLIVRGLSTGDGAHAAFHTHGH